jgi:hypothetical protein
MRDSDEGGPTTLGRTRISEDSGKGGLRYGRTQIREVSDLGDSDRGNRNREDSDRKDSYQEDSD